MNDRMHLVSSFPAPPINYISQYTDKNVAEGIALPPPSPITGSYTMFSGQYNTDEPIVQSLESQGIRRLYSNGANVDRRQELKKLNHSLMANFLDLVELIIRCPSSPERERKLEDINLLFINFHHLINEYRPQQARESLKLMLEVQWQQRSTMVRRFQSLLNILTVKLVDCLDNIPDNLEINFTKDSNAMQTWSRCFSTGPLYDSKAYPPINEQPDVDKADLLLCHLADSLNF